MATNDDYSTNDSPTTQRERTLSMIGGLLGLIMFGLGLALWTSRRPLARRAIRSGRSLTPGAVGPEGSAPPAEPRRGRRPRLHAAPRVPDLPALLAPHVGDLRRSVGVEHRIDGAT